MDHKAITLDVKADGEGRIEGYGSVFNVTDLGGDVVEAGAFRESLAKRMPKMLWQHDMGEPIGVWDDAVEDAKGLLLKGRLATTTTRGRDAYELAKMGALTGLSIGYRVTDYEMDGNNRRIKACDLYETSMVTMPINELARLTSVKGEPSIGDVERALRGIGFSRTEAKAMASGAWKRRDDVLREAGVTVPEDDQREVDELKALLTETLSKMERQSV